MSNLPFFQSGHRRRGFLERLAQGVLHAMAHALDFSDDPDDLVPAVPVGLWQHLGLNDAVLLEVLSLAEKQFEAARVALHL